MSDSMVIVVILSFCIGLFAAYACTSPKKEESPKKEFTLSEKDKIALEALSGKITIEALAERENISAEEINKWKDNFIKDAEYFIEHKNDLHAKISILERDMVWFENICKTYIGDDWKEKTNYDKRNR